MAAPGLNQLVQRSYFGRCIDGIGRFIQERSPATQVLAAGSAMLLLNTAVITAAKFIPDPTSRFIATVLPPILLSIAGNEIGRTRGLQLAKTPLGLGCMTGLLRPIAESMATSIESTKGNSSRLLQPLFSLAFGIKAATILAEHPEPRSYVKTALAIAGLIAADMLIGGSGSLVAGASAVCAAASTLFFSRFPGLIPEQARQMQNED